MSMKKSLFISSVTLCAILHASYTKGSTGSSTNICANYNEECDFLAPQPCCDTNLNCKASFSRPEKVCLIPAKIGLPCFIDEDCNDITHAKCSVGKQCVCRSNTIEMNKTRCAPLVGAFCWNDETCADVHASCVNNVCECKDNHSCSTNPRNLPDGPKSQVEIGSTCENDRECADIHLAVCSKDKRCSCPRIAHPVDSRTCKPNFHISCANDSDCLVEDSSCIYGICSCDPGFTDFNDKCQSVRLGMSCRSDMYCRQRIAFSKCSTTKNCTCVDNYRPVNNACVFELGESCSQTKPCSNLHFNCINDICQCNANYTLWDSQCLPSVVGEFCDKHSDCDAIKFAMCSSHQKCVCNDNYQETNGKCVPVLRGSCSRNEDCLTLNSLCINNKCLCDTNISQKVDYKCLPTKLGLSCEEDKDCYMIPHAKCSYSQCACSKEFIERSGTCALLLGSSCLINEQCAVANSVCLAGVCQCDDKYTEQSDYYCMPVTLETTCKSDIDCPRFALCSANKLCTCLSNYGARNGSVCAPLLNQSCLSARFCVDDNSICLYDTCQCKKNYVAHSNAICKPDYFDKTYCLKNSDCSIVAHAVCDNTQKCVCDKDYTKLNDLLCAPLLNGTCSVNKDCIVENTMCHFNKCICKSNYAAISNHLCEASTLGSRCQSDRNCHLILNSECSSSNICICRLKHTALNEFSCAPILGGYCEHHLDCYSQTMECIDYKCQCKPKFTAMSASLCTETHRIYSCNEPSECSDSWHFQCSSEGKCICQTNNTAVAHATCLPILGGLCWRDDQCKAENSICVDYRCACRNGHLPAADNFCGFTG